MLYRGSKKCKCTYHQFSYITIVCIDSKEINVACTFCSKYLTFRCFLLYIYKQHMLFFVFALFAGYIVWQRRRRHLKQWNRLDSIEKKIFIRYYMLQWITEQQRDFVCKYVRIQFIQALKCMRI